MNIREHLVQFLVTQSHKKYPVAVKAVATVLGATFFLIVFPLLSLWGGLSFFQGRIFPGSGANVIAFVCFGWGIPWMIWAILWQLTQGDGTPVPIVPTKHFLPHGPYRYVRNPMILGFSFYLLGWAFSFNRYGALIVTLSIIILLFLEIKMIEEPELQKRFGEDYRNYKNTVPFMIPRYRKTNKFV